MNNTPWEPEADEWLRQYDGPRKVDSLVEAFNQEVALRGWVRRSRRAVKWRRTQVTEAWRHYSRPVLCVETGVVYNNAEEAAKLLHVCSVTIRVAICRGNKCQGFHWKYVEPETPSADQPSDN